jgi:hypothetical protein
MLLPEPTASARSVADALPSDITVEGPGEPTGCDAPLPTQGQRWNEVVSKQTVFPDTPQGDRVRGYGNQDMRLVMEIAAASGNRPLRVSRAERVAAGWHRQEAGRDSDGIWSLIDSFSLGDRSWSAVAEPLRNRRDSKRVAPSVLDDLGAALARRLVLELGDPASGKSAVKLAQPREATLSWGDALIFPARAWGKTHDVALGLSIIEQYSLSGELTVRAGDAAFVSLVLRGDAMFTEIWHQLKTTYPPVRGKVTLRLERPCFATTLRPR